MNVITNVNFGKKPDEPAPFEPEIIDCVFLSGSSVTVGPDMMEFTGWHDCIAEYMPERRVKIRFAMPRSAAIGLHKMLGDGLGEVEL